MHKFAVRTSPYGKMHATIESHNINLKVQSLGSRFSPLRVVISKTQILRTPKH
jgi:hypothetical protein